MSKTRHGTAIEWTHGEGYKGETWNPVTGCTKVSEGCEHCYIERTPPFRIGGRRFEGPRGPAAVGATTGVQMHPERLEHPLRWKSPRMVFVNSLSDLFHDDIPDWFVYAIWRVMAQTPQHVYQILTKRPGRMASWFRRLADAGPTDVPPTLWRPGEEKYAASFGATREQFEAVRSSARAQMWEAWRLSLGDPPEGAAHPPYDWQDGDRWWPMVLPNVWLGTSVENQHWAGVRIPRLLETPAALRFLSCEPLLGGLDLSGYLDRDEFEEDDGQASIYRKALRWVIVGGESGPSARPMHPDWARSIRDQCVSAGVPFFFKQWGEWAPPVRCNDQEEDDPDSDEARMEAVLEELAGREVVELERNGIVADGYQPGDDRTWLLARLGKKAAGRELDGREWNEMPNPS